MAQLTEEEHDLLTDLILATAEAMFEDREVTIMGNGTNPFEAATALDAVASILSLPSPSDVVSDMYDARESE